MTRRIPPLLLGALLAVAPAFHPRPAQAQVSGYVFGGVGYRHSLDLKTGGLHLPVGLGGWVGPVGLELESGWANDKTLRKAEFRTYARSLNWLSLQFRIRAGRTLRFVLGGGGGLGWIKAPGKAEEVGGRQASQGAHEYLRIDFNIGRRSELPFNAGLRIEVAHLWQNAVIAAQPEHSISVDWIISFGFAGD
jgi:hypothetical protein